MRESNLWLSFLVPVYNVAPYLEECVDSVLAQLEDGVEIVLVNDASTDGSGEVLERLQQRHGAVLRVVEHASNRGISAVRNSLLAAAKGRYLWFLDSDDVLCPGALRGAKQAIEAAAPDLILCDFRTIRVRFALKHRLRGELHRRTFSGPAFRTICNRSELVARLLMQGQLHPWSKIAKREAWQSVVFPEHRSFEDAAVTAQLLGAVASHYYVPRPWVGYRQREGSLLADISADKVRDLAEVLPKLHAGVLGLPGGVDRDARFAVEQFCLKGYAYLARKLARGAFSDRAELIELCRSNLARIFPAGIGAVLRGHVRRGLPLRALRTWTALRRVGLA